MVDSEIIKAFELCFVNLGCKQCPYFYNNKCNEQGELPEKTLEVLTRQKAEIERLLQKLQQPQADTVQLISKENIVHCKECKHLMFSDFEGECSKGYKGIVRPNDSCPFGVREREKSK